MRHVKLIICLILFGCIACAHAATVQQAVAAPASVALAGQVLPTPGALPNPNVTHLMRLVDGTLHPAEPPPAWGFYVVGQIIDEAFMPQGDIQGEGEFGESGTPGWLELIDGAFRPTTAASAPMPPYVRGYMSDDGMFAPVQRQVMY